VSFDHDEIDGRLGDLKHWIIRAGTAQLTFYNEGKRGFRRSTVSKKDATSATSSARSFFALFEFRRFLREEDESIPDRLDTALSGVAEEWFLKLPTDLDDIRSRSDNEENPFTDGHLLAAAAVVPALARALDSDQLGNAYDEIRQTCRNLASTLAGELIAAGGGLVAPEDAIVHDFITIHAVRGIDAAATGYRFSPRRKLAETLRPAVHERALRQLGYHAAEVSSQFDPAELLFSAALLERFAAPDWQSLTRSAVAVVVDAQSDDGAWPTSRVVALEAKRLLHVSSYEVGLTLAFLAARNLAHGNSDLAESSAPALAKTLGLVRSGYTEEGDYKGWSNDRTRWEGLIESWATAIVLTFLIRYRDVLIGLRQKGILERYRAKVPRRADAEIPWPDLYAALRAPGGLDVGPLARYSDPSPAGALVKAIRQKIAEPVADSAEERPEKAALIFFGSPGTRKTSLVSRLAETLNWPLLTLSPPHFLGDGGLEGFEAAADRIFRDLGRLRRVVVLFDECEDFFKPRRFAETKSTDDGNENDAAEPVVSAPSPAAPQPSPPETRTIGAFLTAGMLPRLQALREGRWVIFILATNGPLSALDDAVIRPGRFDFAQSIEHPTLDAQQHYVDAHRQPLTGTQRKSLKGALAEVADKDKGKAMPFAVIDEIAGRISADEIAATRKPLVSALRKRREQVGPPSLY
jgi:hypothetical protein